MDRMGRLAVVEGRRRRRTCSRCTEACRVDDGPTAACTDSSTMARSPSSSASSVASVCFCAAESSAFASDSGWYQSAGGALRVGVGVDELEELLDDWEELLWDPLPLLPPPAAERFRGGSFIPPSPDPIQA